MSRLIRMTALTAGTVAAGCLVAAPAVASTTTHPTSLTVKAAHTAVAPKHKDTLTATLRSGTKRLAGETVYLEKRAAGTHRFGTPVALPTPTDAKGQVSVQVVPGSHKGHREQYRFVFRGDTGYGASHSKVITLTVS